MRSWISAAIEPRRRAAHGLRPGLVVCLAVWLVYSVEAGIVTYTHDAAGRLTAVDYGAGRILTYTYDAAGNLLQRQITTGGLVDTDNDGMDDNWERLFFGDLSRNGAGDLDNDGSSDLGEYLAGTLPDNAASVLKVNTVTTATAASATIEWAAISGRRYRVQYRDSFNVSGWTDLSGDVTASGPTASKLDSSVGVRSQRFYRVQLVP